jgi:hypothetical protein
VRIGYHPEHPDKSSITFESRREEVVFGLNAPLFSVARWRHLTRLGPISKRPVPNPYRNLYPVTVTAANSTVRRVAERIEGEVLEQIPHPENRRVPSHVLSVIKAHTEPVPEPA